MKEKLAVFKQIFKILLYIGYIICMIFMYKELVSFVLQVIIIHFCTLLSASDFLTSLFRKL